nr:MAG TPA: hypothetical protein [Herelleviridae sp.]
MFLTQKKNIFFLMLIHSNLCSYDNFIMIFLKKLAYLLMSK